MKKETKLTNRQEEGLQVLLTHRYSLLYGSSRSGKTFLAVLFILFRAVKKKSRHVIVRYRFSHVKQSIVFDTFPKVCELFGVKYDLNKSDWVARLPNGSEIWFGGLDDKDRTEKILGNEYSTIYLNETSQISYNSHIIMLTRLAEKSGLQLRYLCDENPPNKSHWTYKVFILNVDPETKQKMENAKDYGYLKMHVKDNKANVADGYAEQLRHLPARQRKRFLDGDFSEEMMGALWSEDMINRYRVNAAPQLRETVVAVDPAITSKSTSDKTGILVVGKGFDGRGYVLLDESGIYTPKEWADKVTKLYRDWDANYIVAEANQGGDMVKHTIKTSDPYVPVKLVHATKGKIIRAEPVSSLYEDGMISHVGVFTDLEDEMVSYTGQAEEESPNRLDALVWGVNFLFPVKKDFDAFW